MRCDRRAALIVLAVLAVCLTPLVMSGRDWTDPRYAAAVEALGVRPMLPPFADIRCLTGAWEGVRAGHDVYANNPGDPWGREFNYPRVWLLPALAGFGPEHSVALGLLVTVTFLAALYGVLGRAPKVPVPILLAAGASPAVLLGLAQGNVDLFLFALLVGAALAPWRGSLVMGIMAGAILKLFPALGLYHLLPQRAYRTLGLCLLVFVAYLALTWEDILRMAAVTEVGQGSQGFGGKHFLYRLLPEADADPAFGLGAWDHLYWSLALIVVALAIAGAFRLQPLPRAYSVNLNLFGVGGAIFAGTFLLSVSFNYRLVFLLMMLPQLSDWLAVRASATWARAGLGLTLAVLWSTRFGLSRVVMAGREVAFWCLFAWVLASLVVILRSAQGDRKTTFT